ncbi:hypothetical protein ACGF0J_02325 [Nonomuraea sp. NPDC047897]|uniref:hypothetical protein n=1 Tax=Nonomuraea sp. NPDC047897 TaxID=3364346 RepID=UPI003716B41E
MKKIAVFTVLPMLSAAFVVAGAAGPAGATVGKGSCPTPTKADVARAAADTVDEPARGSDDALDGVRVKYIPKGFLAGQVRVEPKQYAYQWLGQGYTPDKYRNLWVRITCDPSLVKLADLRKPSFDSGEFVKSKKGKVGGRTVLVRIPHKEFREFRDVAWVERKGVVVTVTVSQPLFADLDKIVKGIRVK